MTRVPVSRTASAKTTAILNQYVDNQCMICITPSPNTLIASPLLERTLCPREVMVVHRARHGLILENANVSSHARGWS